MTHARTTCVMLGALGLVAGCSTTARPTTAVQAVASSSTTSPPHRAADVVDGIPLRRLANLARAEAATWSEAHPFRMRVALGSDRAANVLMGRDGMTYNYGDTSHAYVVALDGHFACNPPKCAAAVPAVPANLTPASTETTEPIPVSTMVLTFDPRTLAPDGGLRVVAHEVDLSQLGKVYSLDPYTP